MHDLGRYLEQKNNGGAEEIQKLHVQTYLTLPQQKARRKGQRQRRRAMTMRFFVASRIIACSIALCGMEQYIMNDQ
jgi:hypothetical protein